MNIRSLVRKEVASLQAYSVKDIPCRVKLDANESPYGFEGLLDEAARSYRTNRYPDPDARKLKEVLSGHYGVKEENILQGNGSDELIYYLITTFGGPVLFPVPTFSMYEIISKALGEKTVGVPLDPAFDLDVQLMKKAIRARRPKIIFLSSPNNPTGNRFSRERILEVINVAEGIIVIDEAYQPFSSDEGFISLLKRRKNVVVMRTLSKVGLAALRLGFMLAHREIICEVNKVRLPFNVNTLSQSLAVSCLKRPKKVEASIRKIVAERKKMFRSMQGMRGIEVFPSDANFILFRTKDAKSVFGKLLAKGILVRNLDSVLPGCLRVTIGTPEENVLFVGALGDITG